MSQPRPLSPRLSIYHWHPAMLASIAHRASGLLLALSIPFYAWYLYPMHLSPEAFDAGQHHLQGIESSIFLWLMGTALLYHLCNGIRFLLQDIGMLQSRAALRMSAQLVLGLSCLLSLSLGVYLW